ncbi:MAG: rhomboid family intramembrane serine protease [Rubrobacteraceae bacterium]
MMAKLTENSEYSGGLKTGAVVMGGALLVMWALEILDLLLFGGALDSFGIRPRSVDGLDGIVLHPLLHNGLGHLANNSVPFVIFGLLVFLSGLRSFVVTTTISLLIGGMGVWLFGAPHSLTIGASGLVFGYLGYLLLRSYFSRSVGAVLISILLVLMYGGLLWGLLPFTPGVSWTGHIFGFLGGALSAYLLRQRAPAPVDSIERRI